MRYLRLFTDDDGHSKLEDRELETMSAPFAEGMPPVLIAGPVPAQQLLFVEASSFPDEPHVSPQRQWAVVMSGRAVFRAGGEEREVAPGDIMLMADTTGDGHTFTLLTPEIRVAVVIPA